MIRPRRRLAAYFDFRDWWVGLYNGDHYVYVCPLPTLVIRWAKGPFSPVEER